MHDSSDGRLAQMQSLLAKSIRLVQSCGIVDIGSPLHKTKPSHQEICIALDNVVGLLVQKLVSANDQVQRMLHTLSTYPFNTLSHTLSTHSCNAPTRGNNRPVTLVSNCLSSQRPWHKPNYNWTDMQDCKLKVAYLLF